MSKLKDRVCRIIKGAGLGEFNASHIIINRRPSHSEEKFWIDKKSLYYWSSYTLTDFVAEYRKNGNPTMQDRSELIFKDYRYKQYEH